MTEMLEPCLGILARHQVDLVEHEHEPLALRLAPAYLLLHQPTTTPGWVARVEYEQDHVSLVDDFV
jgi:hypothetical protein